MSACCEKSLLRLHYFDGTFSTNFGTNGVCNLFVGMSAIGSFVLAYFSSIGSIAPLSTYSCVHLSSMSTYSGVFGTPSESDFGNRLDGTSVVTEPRDSHKTHLPKNASYENCMAHTMHHYCPLCR